MLSAMRVKSPFSHSALFGFIDVLRLLRLDGTLRAVPPAAPARDLARHWTLDPAITYLNHGSFGACPRPVLEAQQALRDQLEREPARFFNREAPVLLAAARKELAQFLNAPAAGLALRAQRDHGDQLRAALGAARGGLRAARHRPRVQRDAQHPRVRRRRARLPRRGGAGALPDPGSRGGGRGGALARHGAHAPRRARPRHEPDRAGVPDRRARARARGARRRRARRRRARAGDGRRSTSARSRPPTTPRTATSGSARPRAWASSGCARTAAATCGPP